MPLTAGRLQAAATPPVQLGIRVKPDMRPLRREWPQLQHIPADEKRVARRWVGGQSAVVLMTVVAVARVLAAKSA